MHGEFNLELIRNGTDHRETLYFTYGQNLPP